MPPPKANNKASGPTVRRPGVGKSSGSQIYLPDRAARKAMLAELEKARQQGLNPEMPGYAQFAEYLGRMQTLDTIMDEFSALDPWGLPKKLTAEQKELLEEAMRKTALAGEDFLEEVKKAAPEKEAQMNKGLSGMVGMLQGILSHDYSTLQNYDPKAAPSSLPELMEKSRVKTIELGATQIKAMGGAQSSRIPMSLVNEKGDKRRGFLTKASPVQFKKQFNAGLDMIIDALEDPNDKMRAQNLLKNYRIAKKLKPDCSDEHAIISLLNANFHDKKRPLNPANLQSVLTMLGVPGKKLGKAKLETLVRQWAPLRSISSFINGADLHLKEGDRVDRRNSAMSAVADLMGRPELLARSTDVRFTDEKGLVAEGTFMDYAKGLDLNSNENLQAFSKVSDEPFESPENLSAKPGAFLRQLSDIQVADYLCGNLDRHFGNLIYQTDENGKLIGVQGIDNDSSFGDTVPKENQQIRSLHTVGNMGVISESTKEKIMNMTPAMLKFALRGKGLSEEQLDAAALRLGQLQKAIREGEAHYTNKPLDKDKPYDEGFLRIVPDKDFEKLTIDGLCPPKEKNNPWQKNLFAEVKHWLPRRLLGARSKGFRFEKDKQLEQKPLKEVETGVTVLNKKLSADKMADSLNGISALVTFRDETKYGGAKKLDDLTEGSRTSKQFDNMAAAAKELAALQKTLRHARDSGVQMTAQEYRHYYERLQEAVRRGEETQQLYMERKMKQRKAKDENSLRGKNDYEQRRIDYAKNMGKSLEQVKKQLQEIEAPEAFLKGREDDVRVQAEQRDLDERKAAMEAVRKLHEEKGLASPEELHASLRSDSPQAREITEKFQQEQEKAKQAAEKAKTEGKPKFPGL